MRASEREREQVSARKPSLPTPGIETLTRGWNVGYGGYLLGLTQKGTAHFCIY
jgi:hypothetical protein